MTSRRAIRRIRLNDFRSYVALDLPLSGQPLTLTGPNGAGKTNLLEAFSLFSAGRGLRTSRLADMARQSGPGHWSVALDLGPEDNPAEMRFGIGTSATAPDRRLVRINGEAASGPSALLDWFRFSWLTPAQDRLFVDGAGERRRFLDRMILAHRPDHGQTALAYEKIMRQRNRLLEDWPRVDERVLDALELQMGTNGSQIACAREKMIRLLQEETDFIAETAFPVAGLGLSPMEDGDALIMPDDPAALSAALCRNRARDARAGRTLIGPHRADLLTRHRDKDQEARLCSTGEQKALLIGLILANARVLDRQARERPGDGPLMVLLLDEVAAHLDADRRAELFDLLDGLDFQVVMTGTDVSLFESWGPRAQHIEIRDSAPSIASV